MVNIYMIMMSYLFAPNNDADLAKYTIDGKELVRRLSGHSTGSGSQEKPADVQLAEMTAVPN